LEAAFLNFLLNSQFSDATIQRTEPNFEALGRIALIWCLSQNAFDVLLFESFDGFTEVVHGVRIVFEGRKVRRQIAAGYQRAIAQYRGALQSIL
jgi:hypothetical protein